ncbi:hypothetical protein C4580_01710 [Candidatus Woesearchaeota archaeon]|nr:MAG: hypothetical protein C4580_01710 [Candidatus Woesearchaeota archaeon]
MADALITTTAIAVLLFVGVICSWIGKKLTVPDALLLILAGLGFGQATFKGKPLIEFPELFLSSLAILALAMIVFDSTARLRIRELDTFSLKAVRLMFNFTIFTLILFTLASHYILGISWWTALLFSAIMVGTSPEAVLTSVGKSKAATLLKLESIFNTPLTIILPFLVIDLMTNVKSSILSEVVEQLTPFIMQIIVGIGAGIFVGLILFKLVQHVYAEVYSPLAVIVAALLAYVLAENLGGSGVLSVTALGLFFGNVYVKEKITLLGIETVLAKALYILVFILTGLIIKVPLTKEFFITSGILFGTYIAIRTLAVYVSVRDENLPFHDFVLMALCAPKGIATAAVVFSLLVIKSPDILIILDMTFAFILYSIVVSSITLMLTREQHQHH